MIGWRVGWIVAPEALMPDLVAVSLANVVVPVGIGQDAAAIALESGDAAFARQLLDVAERERTSHGIQARPIERDHLHDLRHRVDAATDGAAAGSPPLSFDAALELLRSSTGTARQQRSTGS